MNKLVLYFINEEAYIDIPKDFKTLKKLISIYFLLSEKSINEINILYNNSDSTVLSIKNEEDYKLFLQKNIINLYLDIGGNIDIYEEYLEAKENNSEKRSLKRINELILKDEEYSKLCQSKFKKEEEEIQEINKLLDELRTRKIELVKYIKKNKEIYEKEQKKIRKELTDLQEKMGLPVSYDKFKK